MNAISKSKHGNLLFGAIAVFITYSIGAFFTIENALELSKLHASEMVNNAWIRVLLWPAFTCYFMILVPATCIFALPAILFLILATCSLLNDQTREFRISVILAGASIVPLCVIPYTFHD